MKSLMLFILSLCMLSYSSFAQSTTYPSGVTGCIARWDFASSGTITSLPDVSGNGNNGAAYNLTTTNGFRNIPNVAMKFDGSSSYAQVTNNTQLCPQQMTMIALVKFSGFYSGHCQGNQIISKGWPYFIDGQYGLTVGDNLYDNSCNIYSPGNEEFSAYFGISSYNQPSSNFIDTSNWYFFASSFDGNTIKYYEVIMDPNNHNNNITPFYSATNLNNPIGTNTQDITVGFHLNPNFPYWFNGSMDEVAIFNKVLSDSEVQSVYDYLWGLFTIDSPANNLDLCIGRSFNLNYTVHANSAIFQSGNIFTAQLSDANGSFANPTNIGSITSTASGSIACTIPTNIPNGNNYQIRLIASNPVYTTEAPIHLNIGALPTHTTTSSNSPVCAGSTLNLNADNSTPGVTYSWTGPNGFSSSLQNPSIPNTVMADSGLYTAVVSLQGCTDTATIPGIITQPFSEGPSIYISVSPSDTFCNGITTTFTSTVANGGTNPTYHWRKNGADITGATSSTYATNTLNDGDIITCIVAANDPCTTSYTATSNAITMHDITMAPPTVTITYSPPNAGTGSTITFTAHVSNATGITFQWRKNGINITGATTSSYAINSLNFGDQISLLIHSSTPCVEPDTVVSNTLTLDVNTTLANYNNLQLYPNPTDGNIILTGTINNTSGNIEIINAIGQVVYTRHLEIKDNEINEKISLTGNIPSGYYQLDLMSGEQKSVLPFILNR